MKDSPTMDQLDTSTTLNLEMQGKKKKEQKAYKKGKSCT